MTRTLLSAFLFGLMGWGVASSSVAQSAWIETLGGPDAELLYDVGELSDGGVVVTGVGFEGSFESVLVSRFAADGERVWNRKLSISDSWERAFSVEETNDGNILVVGAADLDISFDPRPFLIKLDPDGEILWTSLDGVSELLDVGSGIVHGLERADGTIVLAGGANTFTDPQDPWVAVVTSDGGLLSFDEYPPLVQGFGEGTYVRALEETSDGGFLLAGWATPGLGQAFLWKFDSDANEEWVELYGEEGFRDALGAREIDGGYALTGCTLPNCNEAMVVTTNGLGEVQWTTVLDLDGVAVGRDVLALDDERILVAATAEPAIASLDYTTTLFVLTRDGGTLVDATLEVGSESTLLERLEPVLDGFAGVGYWRDSNNPNELDGFALVRR